MKRLNFEEIELREPPGANIEIHRLKPDYDDLGRIPWKEVARIKREQRSGFWFINPVARVFSPDESDEFAAVIEKCEAEWYRLLSRQFKNDWRRQRNSEPCRWTRAFEYDGIIIRDGTVIPLDTWRSFRKSQANDGDHHDIPGS